MLIECLIRRNGGSVISCNGTEYHFAPNASGAHVCDVKNERDIEDFLMIPEGYRQWHPGAKNPWRPGQDYVEAPRAPARELPADAPQNIDQMTRDQLMAYAANLGMRKPHPSITDGKLRMNIVAFLEMRQSQVVPEGDEAGGDEDDEDGEES